MTNSNRPQLDVLWFMSVPVILLFLIAACRDAVITERFQQNSTVEVLPTRTEIDSATKVDIERTPTATPVADTGWSLIKAGIERRVINIFDVAGNVEERFYLVRIDPSFYKFDIAYRPNEPLSLQEWLVESKALLVVNGGYFTDSYEATGLVVADGVATGTSYTGFGGMFWISPVGPELRWLVERPYDPTELIQAGLQSFPMLVRSEAGYQTRYENGDDQPARRTVVAQDTDARIIFIIAIFGALTLDDLSLFLIESDLNLVMALNLDGGASSGLLLAEPMEGVNAYSLLPTVITVYPLQ